MSWNEILDECKWHEKISAWKKDKKELIHCAAMAKLFGFLCTKDITLEKKWLICKMIYGDPHVPMTARINDPFRFRFFIIRKISNVWCFFCLNWALKRILCWWDIKESFQLIDKKGNNEITKKEKKLEKKMTFLPNTWVISTNELCHGARPLWWIVDFWEAIIAWLYFILCG